MPRIDAASGFAPYWGNYCTSTDRTVVDLGHRMNIHQIPRYAQIPQIAGVGRGDEGVEETRKGRVGFLT